MNVRILARDEHGGRASGLGPQTWSRTHCTLVKNIEVLLERPNSENTKYWFCDNCSLSFATPQKYATFECCTQTKPPIVCTKLKQIKFKNYYKQNEVKNVIHSGIECYVDSINKKIGNNTYKISDKYLLPLAVVIMEITNHTLVQIVSKIMSKIYWK